MAPHHRRLIEPKSTAPQATPADAGIARSTRRYAVGTKEGREHFEFRAGPFDTYEEAKGNVNLDDEHVWGIDASGRTRIVTHGIVSPVQHVPESERLRVWVVANSNAVQTYPVKSVEHAAQLINALADSQLLDPAITDNIFGLEEFKDGLWEEWEDGDGVDIDEYINRDFAQQELRQKLMDTLPAHLHLAHNPEAPLEDRWRFYNAATGRYPANGFWTMWELLESLEVVKETFYDLTTE